MKSKEIKQQTTTDRSAMINTGSALDERRGPHDDSREILVKTPGNNSSLRLNAKARKHDDFIVWEVTLPFEKPLQLTNQNSKWVSFGETNADISLIEAIGNAIDEQTPTDEDRDL